MTASQKADFTARTLMGLVTALADRAELDKTIAISVRALADAHRIPIPANYPPIPAS
jgi:hypothetical protein